MGIKKGLPCRKPSGQPLRFVFPFDFDCLPIFSMVFAAESITDSASSTAFNIFLFDICITPISCLIPVEYITGMGLDTVSSESASGSVGVGA